MREVNYDSLIMPYPAAVVLRSQDELRAQAVERRAIDQAAIEGEEPYFFSAEISNNKLDSHYTRMAQSSLKNYAAEADAGVSFLYSHDPSELIGRSVAGRFVGAQGDGVARVTADFFALPGLQLGTVSSDQVIRALKTSVLRDVSVGFYGGKLICSICGRDILRDWDCWHYPGMTYEVEGNGAVTEETCTADVEDAHLAETSGVYKGSTPGASVRGAVIVKAERDAEAGKIKPDARQLIEQRYRIHLPEKRVLITGKERDEVSDTNREAEKQPTPPAAGEANEPQEPPDSQTPAPQSEGETERQVVAFARAQFAAAGFKEEDAPTSMRVLADLALDGTRYREDLIQAALRAGVRSRGAQFQRDRYEAILRRSSVEEIKVFASDWGAEGDQLFAGGRQTVDDSGEPQTQQHTIPPAHAAAYSAS